METVRLKILRGIELIPRDMESSDMLGTSDPFCRVYVDDELIGQDVISRSLNPVVGAGATFYCNVRKTSTVRVVIEDYDAWKVGLNIGVSCNPSADPMGEVTFLASNVLDGRGCRNRWFAVTPTPAARGRPGSSRQMAGRRPRARAPPRSVSSPGPRIEKTPLEYLVGMSPSALLHRAARARAPVWLHIYDVGHAKIIRNINAATELTVGGVFHGAIEVHGRELSFGGCRQNKCGIFACKPRQCPMHTYRERVPRRLRLAKEQVQLIRRAQGGLVGPDVRPAAQELLLVLARVRARARRRRGAELDRPAREVGHVARQRDARQEGGRQAALELQADRRRHALRRAHLRVEDAAGVPRPEAAARGEPARGDPHSHPKLRRRARARARRRRETAGSREREQRAVRGRGSRGDDAAWRGAAQVDSGGPGIPNRHCATSPLLRYVS